MKQTLDSWIENAFLRKCSLILLNQIQDFSAFDCENAVSTNFGICHIVWVMSSLPTNNSQ